MSNMAMTIKVEAPDLVAALMRLAAAVNPDPNILTPDEPRPQMPAPAPAAPIAPPAAPQPPVAAPQGNVTAPVAVPQGNVTAPVAAPTPAAAPLAPTMPPAPAAAPVPPVAAPVAPPAPAPAAPAAPVTTAPTYTLDQIAKAGASLVDAGKMEPLLALLSRYGVQAVTQLAPEHYGAFATELRALGAQI